MIALKKLRELTLTAAASTERPLHLSAASGLVCLSSAMYVVADDELHLGVFSTKDDRPGQLVRLFDGVLPDAKAVRKRQKPDLEALTLLPAFPGFAHGALLAVGSGSRPNRRRGAVLGLDPVGRISGVPRSLDLSAVLVPLTDAFAEVNVEGAVVVNDELRLFQRGNKQHTENAIIRYPLAAAFDVLTGRRSDALRPMTIDSFDLGHVDGVPLCFTDATALPGGDMVFSAVAEDTDDAFNDGACVGAAIGIVGNDGRLRFVRRLDRPYKIEGIHAELDGNRLDLLAVTDADDPDVAAALYSATIAI
ncbi:MULTISPECIES: DUF6929 family protein [Aminobacter]|jgi:hypothetical protein|uniref:Uncharacterized protein n=1 Tax=Aminobacter ciceronei TaxID=150723 RepID=A0ABR6C7B5_9HYPH|nr:MULTISPECIES: hypothetical protein [Aminobacter]MBA8906941.1 hypothetical protein [Aminobacter ciceronei]MBA9020801.1 hypothetical protein [Aminobacter ciceronei]MRX32153.1 hypothetical protein [Aminobacter sp. MDW-2]QNH37575.1 hypothetical protein H5P29_30965 [Aminobacter sp. MDW-2]WMD00336.1 hypothetical protein RAR13_30895 [Aminobacter niigataensis]